MEGSIFFSQEYPDGILYAIDAETGDLICEKGGFPAAPNFPISAYNNSLFFGHGYWGPGGQGTEILTKLYSLDSKNGQFRWIKGGIKGGRMSRVALTSNNILWAPNTHYLFARNPADGEELFEERLPGEEGYPAWGWPIIYKDYLIGAHRSILYVFRGREGPVSAESPLEVYPNPFNESVAFVVNERGKVSLSVYDIAGRLVRIIYSGEISSDSLTLIWDGRDRKSREIPSGVYFAVLRQGANVLASKRVIYLKRR